MMSHLYFSKCFFAKTKQKKKRIFFSWKCNFCLVKTNCFSQVKQMGHIFKLFQCKNKQKKVEKIIIKTYKNCNFFIIILQIAGNKTKKWWTIVKKSKCLSYNRSRTIVPGNESCALHLIGHNKFCENIR